MIGWSLAAVSAIWGGMAFLVFRRFTDASALRVVRKRLYAHLLEIRLFSDEPALVWKAQKALITDNLRFLALVWKPALIMALPFALLYGSLDSIYGWSPLEVGHSTLVTMQLPADPSSSPEVKFTLLAPPGLSVETPPVKVVAERQISWRIRALMPVRGSLLFIRRDSGAVSTRSIAAGDRILSFNRPRESSPGSDWIAVDYPREPVAIAGLQFPWLVWFVIVSTFSASLAAIWPRTPRFRHS